MCIACVSRVPLQETMAHMLYYPPRNRYQQPLHTAPASAGPQGGPPRPHTQPLPPSSPWSRMATRSPAPSASRDFVYGPGELPPLLVKSHGGPTSAASTALNAQLQFWTSRGERPPPPRRSCGLEG
jgi:hypothetical protein